jgi:hypothetical protein
VTESTESTEPTKPVSDMLQTTSDLAKSVGRFSIALSLFAARQMVSLVSPSSAGRAPAADDVTRAAGGQLTGPLRAAYAIGANVSSGLVDAAFSLAGQNARGESPAGDTSGLSISMAARAMRRVAGVRTVASGALSRPVPQSEVVERLRLYHAESSGAAGAPVDREKTVVGLWKSEGLSTSVGKHRLPENTLADPALPASVLPIAHVGFGSGSTEALIFDVERLDALFAECCAPHYAGFSYEGIGAILRIYERGFFKVMSGSLGLIPLDAPDGPNPDGFFATYLAQYPPDVQRLIAHGYGRIVAFSNIDIYAAIEQATAFPAERVEPAVQGCGFAFAFMNSADLPRILEHSAIPFEPSTRAAFQNGLIYSLVFFDWYAPGLLDGWRAAGALEAELVEHARGEAAASRARGYLLPFRLERPRT